jgi:hypothetical protein
VSDPREPVDPVDLDAAFADEGVDYFPEDAETPEVRTPITARSVAIVGARAVAGAVGIGIAIVTVAAATFVPLPTVTTTAPSATIVPVPTAQQLVCPGGILRLADESGEQATVSSPIGEPRVRSHASSGDVEQAPLEQSDAGTGGGQAAPTVVSTPPVEDSASESPLLSAAQSQQVSEGDFVGLAASGCVAAGSDEWLVGGATTIGRTTLITLANPTEVAATVDLELFGENGAIVAPGTSGIIVAPKGQRVLSLAGFQPEVLSPVVHVTSTGGLVEASLQQVVVRGLDSGGVDMVETSQLSTTTVVPGVVITDVAAVQALRNGPGYDDIETVLRVFAPGKGSIHARVTVIPENGTDTGTSFDLALEGGTVTDVPVQELTTGNYTVRIDSQSPAVAAVRVTSASGSATDFSWMGASPTLRSDAQVTIAPGPAPTLHLANPSSADHTVTVTLDGADTPVSVAAGVSVAVPVEAGKSYQLSGLDGIYAAVSFAGGGMIARYSVQSPGEGSAAITIYP